MGSEEIVSAIKDQNEIELTVKERKSGILPRPGKLLPRPVWFVLRGNSILLIPVEGRETQWYLNVKKDPNVKIRVGHHSFWGKARELEGREGLKEALDLFTAKYGKKGMEEYYHKKDVALEVPIPP